ncbi:hypothetical protein BDV18DRAFT_135794 [Aspergillus unguis]
MRLDWAWHAPFASFASRYTCLSDYVHVHIPVLCTWDCLLLMYIGGLFQPKYTVYIAPRLLCLYEARKWSTLASICTLKR